MAAHARDKLVQRQEKLEVGYLLEISIIIHLVQIDSVALHWFLSSREKRERRKKRIENKRVTVYTLYDYYIDVKIEFYSLIMVWLMNILSMTL